MSARVQLVVPVKVLEPRQVMGFLPARSYVTVIVPPVSVVDAIAAGSRSVPLKLPPYGPEVRNVDAMLLPACVIASCGIARAVLIPVLTWTKDIVPAHVPASV